ncbi:hypothetical protein PENSUB_11276 [Penicillium subrubescens]|uniref:Uncharacterized protein n=1 Tax=Penicillium subrubescens TaxID=1316194 RepID=A0A1Q5T4Q0_9EURO|nr:hypothetical protein PENSUB_11276 [Penicillium subrubescens]
MRAAFVAPSGVEACKRRGARIRNASETPISIGAQSVPKPARAELNFDPVRVRDDTLVPINAVRPKSGPCTPGKDSGFLSLVVLSRGPRKNASISYVLPDTVQSTLFARQSAEKRCIQELI